MFGYVVLIICVYAFYQKFVKPVFYWKVRGVFYTNLYARFFKVFVSDKSFLQVVRKAYEEFPDRRYYGSYQFLLPSLFIRDLELIKKVTVKDFECFHDHASAMQNENVDPVVNQNLFSLKGQKWRDMRSTLSPVFTSSKMRQMFTLIAETAENFTNYFLDQARDSKLEMEMKDFYSKYTNDVIATCAFGIECDSLRNKDNEFFKMGKFFSTAFRGRGALRGLLNAFFPSVASVSLVPLLKVPDRKVVEISRSIFDGKNRQITMSTPTLKQFNSLWSVQYRLVDRNFGCPICKLFSSLLDNMVKNYQEKFGHLEKAKLRQKLLKQGVLINNVEILKISVFPSFVSGFFKRIVQDTIACREKGGIVRPDLIHLLMQARKGQLNDDENDLETAGFATTVESNAEKSDSKTELTDDLITAQALVFFFAGFETSSTLLAFLSYELALNQDVQEKLQNEIDDTLKTTNGILSYDAILKMKYLDQVVSETLRVYPPGFAISRTCTKEYLIPAQYPNEKDLIMEKGCLIVVPVYGIHMDPEYFPNPEKFDPDRFSDENKNIIVAGTYMPFGSGPRNCIGSRFALLETKALVVSLCSKFKLVPIAKTEIPVKLAKTAILGPKNGLWLGLEKRS